MYKLPTDPLNPLLINGDAFIETSFIPSCSLDSIIIDFPYLIEFMSLQWDVKDVNTAKNYINLFKECLRILKPGGKMLGFTGTINYDLFMNWARSAGFSPAGMLIWLYASGMPHGIDAMKYILKQNHLSEVDSWNVDNFTLNEKTLEYDITVSFNDKIENLKGIVPKKFLKFVKYYKKSKHKTKSSKNLLLSKLRYIHAEYFGYSVISYDHMPSDEYESGMKYICLFRNRSKGEKVFEGEWIPLYDKLDGLNSGIKPAFEPILQIEKPISEETIVKNILTWGTGAYNIGDCKIPLTGMRDIDVKQFVKQLKMEFGWYPKTEKYDLNIPKEMIEDLDKSCRQRDNDNDKCVYDENIRDRLDSGGGSPISKDMLNDLVSQITGSNRRAINKEKRGFDNGNVYDEQADSMNAGGRAISDEHMGDLMSDLKKQIVGFQKIGHIDTVYEKNHADHVPHNISSDGAKEAIKFLKGSHPMYGSSGSGITNYNNGEKIIKKDVDELIESTKEIHRKVNLKSSGSGIQNYNKEKDLSEQDIRDIQKELKDQTTRHDPNKHKGALFGGGDIPMDNKSYQIMSFFDKMYGRYPSNVITTEFDALKGAVIETSKPSIEYDKIFLVGKPGKSEKFDGVPARLQDEFHKTVKPLNLMNHLIKLITPKDGIVGDFMVGSGSTGVAAKANNFCFIGIELDATYYEIAKKRIASVTSSQRSLW